MGNCAIHVNDIATISLTLCIAKSRNFLKLFYCIPVYLCVYFYVFFIFNITTKGNTSLMLNKLLLYIKVFNMYKNSILCGLFLTTEFI